MASSRRRVFGALLVAGALALVLLALGLFPQEPVRSLIEKRLRAATGPGSHIGALRLRPVTLQAELTDVVIETPAYRLQADRVSVRLAPRTLAGPGLHIRTLEAGGVRLTLRTSEQEAPASAPYAGPLRIDDVRVSGAVVWEGPETAGRVRLNGLEVLGSVGDGRLRIAVDGGAWARARTVPIGPARAVLRIASDLAMDLESLDAGLERSRLSASGPLGRPGALRPDVAFEARLVLEELAAHAGSDLDVRGAVVTRGRIQGASDDLRMEARAEGEDLRVGLPVRSLAARIKSSAGGIEAEVDLRLLGGTGRAVARRSAEGRLSGDVVLRQVDLSRLKEAGVDVAVSGVGGAEATVRGEPGQDLLVTWRVEALTDRGRFAGRGTARGTTAFSVRGEITGAPVLPGLTRRTTLAGTFDARGGDVRARLDLQGLGEPIHVEADLAGAQLRKLAVVAEGVDLTALAPEVSGRARVRLGLRGALDALDGTGDVSLHDVRWRGVALGDLTAQVTGEKGRFRVQATAPALASTADLVATTRGQPRISGTVDTRQAPLAILAPLVGPDREIDGTLTARVVFDAPLDRPAEAEASLIGSLDVAYAEWKARGTEVGFSPSRGEVRARSTEPIELSLHGRVLEVARLALEGAGSEAGVHGRIDLHGKPRADLHVELRSDLSRLPLPEGSRAQGAVSLQAHVTGTQGAPRAEGTLRVDALEVVWPRAPAVTAREVVAELRGDRVALPGVMLDVAGGRVDVDAEVPFAAVMPALRGPSVPATSALARIRVRWADVEAGQILAALRPEATQTVAARLAGRVEATGALPASGSGVEPLQQVKATARLEPFQALVGDMPVDVGALEATVRDARVQVAPLTVRAAGGEILTHAAVDLRRRDVEGAARGVLDLRALSPFLRETALTGVAELNLEVSGPWAAPVAQGRLEVRDGTARLRAMPQALTDIAARLSFAGREVRIEQAGARLGGGPLTVTGGAGLAQAGIENAQFTIVAREVALRYPPGMRTRLDGDLTLTGRTGAFVLGGEVRTSRGLYDLDVALEETLRAPVRPSEESPFLRSLALDLRVRTESPVVVRNNMVDLRATGDLRVRGDAFAPAPLGTLRIAPAGRVFLQARELRIVEGSRLTYEGTWDPQLHVQAETPEAISDIERLSGLERAEVKVTVRVEGTLLRPRLRLQSTPSYSEPQIVSLLATGDSQAGAGAAGVAALGGQAAALLVGRLGRELRGLGLDEVSIQPELVAREGDVAAGARFTFGKRVTPWATLVYSANLQSAESRYVELQTEPAAALGVSRTLQARTGGDFTLSGRRREDGLFAAGAGQRFRFGGPRHEPAPVEDRVRVREVRIEGDRPLEPDALRGLFATRPGDRRTTWQVQEDADQVREKLRARGWIEAEVGARLDGDAAVFDVRSGARYRTRVTGVADPPSLDDALQGALFEEEALERGRARLLRALGDRGHLRAAVATRAVDESPGVRTLVFEAEPGPRLVAVVGFPGASAAPHARLETAAGGAGRFLSDPEAARTAVLDWYRERQYLTAEVGPVSVVSTSPDTVAVTVPVREGPRARLASVELEGATRDPQELRSVLDLAPGTDWNPAALDAALVRLQAHYYEKGYPSVRLAARARRAGPDLVAVVEVAEGSPVTVAAVELTGLSRTREALVRRRLGIRPGDPLDPRRLATLEQRVLDLGVFTRVTTTVGDGSPATVRLDLEEGDRLVAGYELRWDQEDHGSALLDAEVRNLFGVGLGLGARHRVAADVRQTSVSLFVPALFRGGRVSARVFQLAEDVPPIDPEEPETQFSERGFGLDQEVPLGRKWSLLLGYTSKTTRTTFPPPADPVVIGVAGLDVSLIRDTRDEALDARRGTFSTLSLRYAPSWLRSDLTYVRGLAQIVYARPLGEAFTWAQAVRLGFAGGLGGQNVRSSERFRAGGGNSVRGFATDALGPLDFLGEPAGGDAVMVLNEEVRWRHPTGFGAVAFWDAGEVWAAAGEVGLDVRHALGAGLRYKSPVGLLRLDVGFPLRPREGEKAWRLSFSLGQAF